MKTMLREKLVQAMRDKDSAKKDILRLALGQIEATEAKMPANSNEEKLTANSVSVVKKIINENATTIELASEEVKNKLVWENEYLSQFLPITMDKTTVESHLIPLAQELKTMKEGQAMGLAMKTLKPYGALDSAVVKQVLDKIRNG